MAAPHLPTTLADWLDDLTVRFLLNLPSSELSSVPRLCFQVEEAQWYYEDFVRPAVAASGAPPLPSLHLRQFLLLLFQHCPLFNGFSGEQHLKAYEEFLAYKVRVPVRGAIMLDQRMEKVVLVRGWKKGASWSFPRGKINKDEKDLHCAIREVWEETGFDIRAAGLVPENEDDANAIDVTMREQHMRLFVFRGVPEDTHFEPKTRKEIGKIQWYSIKDLPGFKKHKAGQPQQGDAANSNKFYMVAPFLGHLKKWISHRQREDHARAKRRPANGPAPATGTEDEDDVEEDTTPERDSGVTLRSEELKQLLSIGGGTPTTESDSQAQPSRLPSDSANLLAMLQGTAKPTNGNIAPRTPFEQINPFPQQPESPHPHHMRQPSSAEQQHFSPPRFPLSSPQPQDMPGRQYSLPTPNIFGPAQNGFPPPHQHPVGYHGMPPHMQQQQQQQMPPQRQSMPPGPPPGFPFGQQNGAPPGFPINQQLPRPPSQQMPPHMLPQHLQQPAPAFNSYIPPQGPQGAIGTGPSAPNPSQLPAPRQLGAEKMRLLDAFRNPANGATPPGPASSAQTKQRPASTHQTALLDLFRKPSQPADSQPGQVATSPSMPEKKEVLEPASPTGTDVTIKPSATRRPTLNEITRTLPLSKPKTKSPPINSETAPHQSTTGPFEQPPPPNSIANRANTRPEPPKERQLFDPNNPTKFTSANLIQPPKSEWQLPDHKRSLREFHNTTSPTSPSRNGHLSQNGHRATPPPFTILARPGSSKGAPKSPAAPPSPLRHDASKPPFHPQVLKRPKESDFVDSEQKPADKKDQLLALFGKTAPQSGAAASASTETKPTVLERKESAANQKNRLLGLFNTASNTSTPPAAHSQAPPPAPRIEPEQRPTSTRQQPTLSTTAHKPTQSLQQNVLLDLFSGKKQSTPTQSPGTPISPFTLGTPAVEEQVKRFGGLTGLVRSTSIASVDGSEQSPQEQKDFLMGFLNGVVRNEGSKAVAGRK